jgi:predicted O-methyltransferase YrrM
LRRWCEGHRVPCITPATEQFLRTYITEKKPQYIGEIGSAVWYSAIAMAQTCMPWHGQVWSIEYSFPDYHRALQNAWNHKQYNITFYYGDGNTIDYTKLCWEKMNLIYIDGRKRDYLTYFHHAINIVAPDATIIFDDIIKFAHKTFSLYEFLAEKQIQYTIHKLDEDDGIMVIENAGIQIDHKKHP